MRYKSRIHGIFIALSSANKNFVSTMQKCVHVLFAKQNKRSSGNFFSFILSPIGMKWCGVKWNDFDQFWIGLPLYGEESSIRAREVWHGTHERAWCNQKNINLFDVRASVSVCVFVCIGTKKKNGQEWNYKCLQLLLLLSWYIDKFR